MRIGLLTQWYPPEPGPAALPGQLATELVARGHQVQVVTGFPNYPTGVIQPGYTMQRSFDEKLDGVDVRRVALYTNHSQSFVKRFANYGSFAASAAFSGISALRDCDAVWVNYSPITISWAMWLAQLTQRTPMVTHVLDLWPDTLSAGGFAKFGFAGKGVDAALNLWCNSIYRSSDSVAYISRSVGATLLERGVPASKLEYVPMWANEAVFSPTAGERDRGRWGLPEDAIVLLYAGTIGAAQGIDTLLDACELITDPRFHCVIAGGGVGEADLVRRLENSRAANLRFIGRVPPSDMASLTATSDASAVLLADHPLTNMTMPSKLQANLASGKPIVIAAAGDAAAEVTRGGVGFVAKPGNAESLATAIRELLATSPEALQELGAQAAQFYRDEYALSQGTQKIEALLQRAADRRQR